MIDGRWGVSTVGATNVSIEGGQNLPQILGACTGGYRTYRVVQLSLWLENEDDTS